MTSTLLIKLLLIEYLIIFIVCLFEKNYAKALYWLSASGLQVAVLKGMR